MIRILQGWTDGTTNAEHRLDHGIARTHRKGFAYESEGAIRFRMPKDQKVIFDDIVKEKVEYPTADFEDLVIMKSDGFPTFHLAVIVDDHDMGVTHVIRGDDHLPNTPRHILIQRALGWKSPRYGHLPLILGADGTPLSKRHGAVAVTEYRKQGFLPEGLLNYLALLGWNPGDNQEIFTLQELIKRFSLKRIIKSAACFNPEKLLWLNGEHIRKIRPEDYETRITEFWKGKGSLPEERKWRKLIALYRPRIETLGQLMDQASYCFSEPNAKDHPMMGEIKANKPVMDLLRQLRGQLEELEDFEDVPLLDQKTKQVAESAGFKPKDIIHPLRFVLTGGTASPGIFELMSLLGKETCLKRLSSFFL